MSAMLIPLALLLSPPSITQAEGKRVLAPSIILSAPAPKLAARIELDDFALPSRIAWTIDLGGQPVTFVPLRPSGGFQLNIEMTF